VPEQRPLLESRPDRHSWFRAGVICALVLLVAACSSFKKQPDVVAPPKPIVLPVVIPLEPTPGLSPRERINKVLTLLEQGDLRVARVELVEYLREKPTSEIGKSLLAQIDEEPKKLMGEKSFAYTIKSGESLYELAERFLDDQFKFIGLARYNNIAVPEKALAGQVIQIPGEPKEVTARKVREQQQELDARLAAEAPKPEPEKPVVVAPPPPKPAEPTASAMSRANLLRKDALVQMQRGFADKAAGLLEEALKLFPNSQLIKKDLERARRLQSLPRPGGRG
jgi:hypothetical protein